MARSVIRPPAVGSAFDEAAALEGLAKAAVSLVENSYELDDCTESECLLGLLRTLEQKASICATMLVDRDLELSYFERREASDNE